MYNNRVNVRKGCDYLKSIMTETFLKSANLVNPSELSSSTIDGLTSFNVFKINIQHRVIDFMRVENSGNKAGQN